jgi:uncharacterized protein (TIGR02284 family)
MEDRNTLGINTCNRLIVTCEDGAAGFRLAAESAETEALKELFMELSEQREFMVTDLQGEIRSLGSEPNEGGSIAGAFQRGWLNIKHVASDHDDHAILEEVRAGEEAAIRSYQDALREDLPPLTRQMIERHYEEITAAYNRVRQLEVATR